MRRTDLAAEQGFLYVEVLVSLVLLGLALLATAPLFIMAAQENAAASDLTFATTAAHDMAESLKGEAYPELVSGEDVCRLAAIDFARSWTVEEDVPYSGMKTVTVTVVPARSKTYGENRVATVRFYQTP